MMNYRSLLFLAILISFSSCTNEFSLEGDFQDVPTAYAYLNADDDRHFVRLQKAFLEAGGNALAIAAIADSIYYGENDATVILVNRANNQQVELERVDGNQFDLEREDGIFATEPNIVYTVEDRDINLSGGDEIELRIERPNQEVAVATTVMLDPINIRSPNELARIDDYSRPLNISFSKVPNAAIYDIRLIFTIQEFYPADESRNRTIDVEYQAASSFVPGDDQASTSNVVFSLENESIFSFLRDALPVETGVRRRFTSFAVQVTAAGVEVLELRTLANANAGITSSQVLPRYTNIDNGIGLITGTTTTLKGEIDLDPSSRDSLKNGFYTKDLNFL